MKKKFEEGGQKILTKEKAKELLLNGADGNIMPEFKIKHNLKVGEIARKVAEKCGLNGDYAEVLGIIHDIGCHFNKGEQHPYFGYIYLKSLGYDKYANICLSHSFIKGDPNSTLEGIIVRDNTVLENHIIPWKDKNQGEEMLNFLRNYKYSDYDEIIVLCDLSTTIEIIGLEERLKDLIERKGKNEATEKNCEKAKNLRNRIEKKMGCTMLELFPEINENKGINYKTITSQNKKE